MKLFGSSCVLAAFAVVAGCLGCRAPVPPVSPPDPRTSAERAEDRSVSLLDWEDSHPNCGGAWVSRTEILTARHCVEDNGKPVNPMADLFRALGVEVPEWGEGPEWDATGQAEYYHVKNDTKKYPAMIVKMDAKHDLALLVAEDPPPHDYAHIRLAPLHDGQELDVVGDTVGLEFSYSRCVVGAAVRDGWKLQVAGPVFFGNSGGGAFDSSGDLVGIALHMRSTSHGLTPDLSFWAGPRVLAEFLVR
jgi:S1-C subfamily serine protease